jgi:hypothetical protein
LFNPNVDDSLGYKEENSFRGTNHREKPGTTGLITMKYSLFKGRKFKLALKPEVRT